MKAVYYSI